jgi:hypothetical protein
VFVVHRCGALIRHDGAVDCAARGSARGQESANEGHQAADRGKVEARVQGVAETTAAGVIEQLM